MSGEGQTPVETKPSGASDSDFRISRSALESVPLRNQIESTDLQVFYQPEGVSLRFYPQPEANAFRLILHLVSQCFPCDS